MPRYFYVFLVLILTNLSISFASKPAKAATPSLTLKTDSSTIRVRNFIKDSLSAYSKQYEFQYIDGMGPGPSLWTRFWRWFWHLFDFLKFKHYATGSFLSIIFNFLKYLFIILGLSALVFFILKMAGIDMFALFSKKSKTAALPYSESLENIHEIDFGLEIEKAVSQHNYRLAVRLLYLRSLKQLNDASLIDWQPDKTNSAFIDELNNPVQKDTFRVLTRQFEYVWYGEFPIDGNVFDRINLMFHKFRSEIA
jgi:ABC-type dipeptide/oligopeptide/nickel transport system permease component